MSKRDKETLLRSSQRSSWMTGRVVDITLETVESVSVIKLRNGLCCGIVAEVVLRVFFGTENGGELASPDSQIHCVQSQ